MWLMCMSLRLLQNLCSVSAGFAFFCRIFCGAASIYTTCKWKILSFFLFYIEFILMQKAYLNSASSVVTD